MATVKLHYFKERGKYYSDGQYESKHDFLWDIVKEVCEMRILGELPGLVKGANEFIIHILPRSEDDCVPHILPLEPPVHLVTVTRPSLLVHYLCDGDMLHQTQGMVNQPLPEQDDVVLIKGQKYWVMTRWFTLTAEPLVEVTIQLQKADS